MAGRYAVNAPISTGFRRRINNIKKSNIKKSSYGIKKRFTGKGTSFEQSKYQNGVYPNISRQSNEIREVRVIVSNLAPSVVSDDLRELFDEFNPRNVCLEIEKQGNSFGTGSITVSKFNADRMVDKFDGKFALDGEVLKFTVMERSSIASRIKLPNIQKRVHFTGRQTQFYPKYRFTNSSGQKENVAFSSKNRFINRSGVAQKNVRDKNSKRNPKMTIEELDAELDAYMGKCQLNSF